MSGEAMTSEQLQAIRERVEAFVAHRKSYFPVEERPKEVARLALMGTKVAADVPALCDKVGHLTLALATVTAERDEAREQLAQLEGARRGDRAS